MKLNAGFPQMSPIALDEMLARAVTPVNLYVQLSDQRFVLVSKAGARTAELSRYKDRKISYLYVRQADFSVLLTTSISIAEAVIRNPAATDQAMLFAIEPAVSALYSELLACGFNREALAHSRLLSEVTLLLCGTDPQFHKILQSLLKMRDAVQKHALLTSAICSMIGIGLGWTKPATLEKCALAGLLHDVGEIKLPKEISEKNFDNMSHDELVIYRSHTEIGRDLTGALSNMPSDVSLAIFEHHELADGSGYPRGVRDLLTSPMGRVVIVANAFAELVTREETVRGHLVEHAFEILASRDAALYNKDVIKALVKMRDRLDAKTGAKPAPKKAA